MTRETTYQAIREMLFQGDMLIFSLGKTFWIKQYSKCFGTLNACSDIPENERWPVVAVALYNETLKVPKPLLLKFLYRAPQGYSVVVSLLWDKYFKRKGAT